MYIRKFLVAFILLFFCILNIESQDIITYKKVKSMTKEAIANTMAIPAKYDVDVYVIEYTTKKLNLEKDTASGVLAVAKDTRYRFPVAVYDHGTVDNRNDVPSKGSSEQMIAIAIASYGYHCVAPDYIGLGISKGLHPYVNPESEAWATIDLINASYTISNSEPVYFNEQVFVTGYSQGGHAAMATAFSIEQRYIKGVDSMKLTAAVPMAGPYSISKEMIAFTLGDKEYSFCAYLASAFLSAKMAHFDLLGETSVEDVFLPEYAEMIRRYESETIGLFTLNNLMKNKLSENGGKIIPKRMLKPEYLTELLSNPSNNLHLALTRMDICNWVPEAQVKMLYCKADDQVTYRNAVYTDSLMRASGALKVSSQDVMSSGNHSTCFYPALLKMISVFNGLQRIDLISKTEEVPAEISIYPNPVDDKLIIDLEKNMNNNYKFTIYDICGKIKISDEIRFFNKQYSMNVGNLNTGIYFLRITDENSNVYNHKFVIQR